MDCILRLSQTRILSEQSSGQIANVYIHIDLLDEFGLDEVLKCPVLNLLNAHGVTIAFLLPNLC